MKATTRKRTLWVPSDKSTYDVCKHVSKHYPLLVIEDQRSIKVVKRASACLHLMRERSQATFAGNTFMNTLLLTTSIGARTTDQIQASASATEVHDLCEKADTDILVCAVLMRSLH